MNHCYQKPATGGGTLTRRSNLHASAKFSYVSEEFNKKLLKLNNNTKNALTHYEL